MNKESIKTSAGNIIYKTTLLSAIALSIGACSGIGTGAAAVSSVTAALFCAVTPEISLFPVLLNFLIQSYIVNTVGYTGAFVAILMCSVYAFFLLKSKKTINALKLPEIKAPLMLATALSVTVLITTYYFGIGAAGNTVPEMFKDYRSLGFHPNWRGILYGTIVMVIMITFPRKFKKGSRIFSAAFAAIIFTYILNLLLIPAGTVSPIEFTGEPGYAIFNGFNFEELSAFGNIMTVITGSFAMAVTVMITGNRNKASGENSLYDSLYILLNSVNGWFFTSKVSLKNKKQFIEGLISAVLIALIMFVTKGFERLPLASCAVVLIVGAWQSVEWGMIKKSFSSPVSIIVFTVLLVLSILLTPVIGVAAAFIYAVSKSNSLTIQPEFEYNVNS
ncbi:MAG: hypothetical protein IKH65_02685 [Clostridia bacterium]|nr:hypothetical protein [Clostridia bacterium]